MLGLGSPSVVKGTRTSTYGSIDALTFLFLERGRFSPTSSEGLNAADEGKIPSRIRHRPFSKDIDLLVDSIERPTPHSVSAF
jgi:hypothetical protein